MRRSAPPVERVKEVLLDAKEIIKQSHMRAPEPQTKSSLDDVLQVRADRQGIDEMAESMSSRPALPSAFIKSLPRDVSGIRENQPRTWYMSWRWLRKVMDEGH